MKTVNLIQGSPEWSAHRAQHLLHARHSLHAMLALGGAEVRELLHMGIPNHPVKRGKAALALFNSTHHAQVLATPDQGAAIACAQRTCLRAHTSTRSIPPALARAT